MLTQKLIEVLQKTLKLHQSLYEIAVEKTEVIKSANIESLQNIIQNEQKHIAAIQMFENQRQELVARFKKDLAIEMDGFTISALLTHLNGPEKEQIQELQANLIQQVDELKNVNTLNQQLLMHSLQFVHLNLNFFDPEPESPNYTKSADEELVETTRSLFDSQA